MLSAVCLAAALTAVQTSTASAAPTLDPNTPVSDDGRVGSQIQRIEPLRAGPRHTAGSAGTGNPSDAKGVRPVDGPGPRVVAPDEFSTQSIIAPDQRVQVTNTTTYPARANVYFTYTKPNGTTSWCTGWMYAANAVATAGHCVHAGAGGAWNTNFTVYPGRNGSSSPYGSCGVSSAFTVAGWTQSSSVEYDYAALKLTCTVGNTTGWYGLRWTTTSFNGTAVSSAGYPQDKASATQWSTSSAISATYVRQLAYHLDTVGGQSGSVVYTSGCTTYCALAVHAYGYGDHNRGTRITETAYNNFTNWKL